MTTGRHPLALLAAPCLLLAGCGRTASPEPPPTAPVPVGSSVQDLAIGDDERAYRIHHPTDLPAEPALVLVLHGAGGSARQAEESYGWTALADREGFLVAHPDGLHRTWNTEGGCCGRAAAQDVDDVAFLTAVVEDVARRTTVDMDRVFVTGMSNGAMMSYTLACSTDIVAAIAPVAGTMLGECADPAPVSVLHLHGTADAVVRMDGEPGERLPGVDPPPLDDVVDHWRSVDDCLEPSEVSVGPVRRSVSGCADGRSVELVTVEGAGHEWPGASPARQAADPAYPDLDATAEIWRFFAAHPKP